MAAQLAEQLLAVLWLDRCRQVQRLGQGRTRAYREELARVFLAAFIAEQRWGLASPVATEDGVEQPGVLNFDPAGWSGNYHPHFLEMCIFDNIVTDVERGEWVQIDVYMNRAEFFAGIPRGSLRRLPEGAPSR